MTRLKIDCLFVFRDQARIVGRKFNLKDMERVRCTCSKISVSSSPSCGIITEWDGWILTL